jgi:hypothetical protein
MVNDSPRPAGPAAIVAKSGAASRPQRDVVPHHSVAGRTAVDCSGWLLTTCGAAAIAHQAALSAGDS